MEGSRSTFCTIFPFYRDFHFYKDPGQIPYRISKLGYDSTLVCYGNISDFPDSSRYLKIRPVRDSLLSRKFNSGIIVWLLFNSQKIDVLNTFHLTWNSLLFVFIYKALNRTGFSYIKLDNCSYSGVYPWEEDFGPAVSGKRIRTSFRRRLKGFIARKYFLKKVDLWSIEDDHSREHYERKYDFFRGRIITIYNGHTSDLPGSATPCKFEDKEEIILTAGRLGTYQKATEVLLEAYRTVASQSSYSLHLAGPIDVVFNGYIERYFLEDPAIKERVIFHGSLDREELYRLYCRSSIFCMSSRYEGMAIVFPEAMYYMNAIVTTWPVSPKQLIEENGAGLIVPTDDPGALADALLNLIKDRERMADMALKAYAIAYTEFNWDNIARSLVEDIEKRRSVEKHPA